MNRLLILAVLLAVFSSPSFAKEKETFIALGGSLKCLHTDGTVRDGACDCMPDSPGSCANTVGADGAGMAPPVKASVKSAYVHRPDSTQYHPEGEGGTKPKPASVGRAYVHRPDSTQYHPEGEGGTKPKPASVGRAYVHRPDSTQYHPEGQGDIKAKVGVSTDMPPRDIDKPLNSDN